MVFGFVYYVSLCCELYVSLLCRPRWCIFVLLPLMYSTTSVNSPISRVPSRHFTCYPDLSEEQQIQHKRARSSPLGPAGVRFRGVMQYSLGKKHISCLVYISINIQVQYSLSAISSSLLICRQCETRFIHLICI